MDFQLTFQQKSEIEIENKKHEYILKYGIAIEFTLDELEFYEIDYYGMLNNNLYDYVALGLETEFNYYKKNNFKYENSKIITYCNMEEWTEGYTEDESTTFEILETSLNYSGKDKPYWWLTIDKKKELVRNYIEEKQLEKAFQYGENNFIEFKPSLLYNFKTKQASIGVKRSEEHTSELQSRPHLVCRL